MSELIIHTIKKARTCYKSSQSLHKLFLPKSFTIGFYSVFLYYFFSTRNHLSFGHINFCARNYTSFKVSNSLGNLKAHILRVHNAQEGEPTYACSYCSCIFKKLGSLNGHIKRMHSVSSEVSAILICHAE